MSFNTTARVYTPGIGDAVADRTINRLKEDGTRETWADVALRVAVGNALLAPKDQYGHELHQMHHHLRQASILMSGRHLQHGDATQPTRNQEVFTNCLEGSTRILTMEYGAIEIEKIAGQAVTVIAGDGKPRVATINEHGEQPVNEYVFRQNVGGGGKWRNTVLATENHRWKLRDGSITENLRAGDVLHPTAGTAGLDPAAVVHGLVYGDGTAHKRRQDSSRPGVSQGRTYASIRVCKQDAVAAEIHGWLDDAGYSFTTPASAAGDRVYYIGKFEHAKGLPFTNDPEYIAGFIYGWWLADGSKGVDHALEISTSDATAAAWLREHAAFAGFSVTMHRTVVRKEGDGSYVNGKPLHCLRIRKGVEWKVETVRSAGTAKVYCPEEPVTSMFVLADGMLTGNCSTAANTFLTFYLLLNGSGVGRAYDDNMIVADLNKLPIVVPVINMGHKDCSTGEINIMDRRTAEHLYAGRERTVFSVPDSREGWAKALELMETMAFEGDKREHVLILDFSDVRPRGAPIGGMQNRPASGPGPLIAAIRNVAQLRDAGMEPWRAAMYADHYIAECVLVGGARRAARMATKFWKDPTVLGFVQVKRGGFLWSSNNSVTVDKEFWDGVKAVEEAIELMSTSDKALRDALLANLVAAGHLTASQLHAHIVFEALAEAAYFDQTGEPGIINVDMLTWSDEGTEVLMGGDFAESERYKLDERTKPLMKGLATAWKNSKYKVITNPCGEIVLGALGGYCVIADVVPFHAASEVRSLTADVGLGNSVAVRVAWDNDAEDAFRTATRALIRTNTMDCLYGKEVKRTNRIGVGMTGLHEYAWSRFGFGWKDIVDEAKSIDFWKMLSRFKRAVQDEAKTYSESLGVNVPHTNTTMKPAGTTSKLFGLTEGAHLPSMREYLRWVQFRNDDPLIAEYEAKGYPVRRLKTYSGTTIVGFPTSPTICTLGMGDKLVTAAEATPEEQYEYLRLLEKWWIIGMEEDGATPLEDRGNQVSYTLKYDPKTVTFDHFKRVLLEDQSSVRCCSVMPQADTSAYEYQPEQPVSKHEFELIANAIKEDAKEDIGMEHVECGTGGCPIDFSTR